MIFLQLLQLAFQDDVSCSVHTPEELDSGLVCWVAEDTFGETVDRSDTSSSGHEDQVARFVGGRIAVSWNRTADCKLVARLEGVDMA
jgi:hypothetical protein